MLRRLYEEAAKNELKLDFADATFRHAQQRRPQRLHLYDDDLPLSSVLRGNFFQLSADAKCNFPDYNLIVGSSGRDCEKSLRK